MMTTGRFSHRWNIPRNCQCLPMTGRNRRLVGKIWSITTPIDPARQQLPQNMRKQALGTRYSAIPAATSLRMKPTYPGTNRAHSSCSSFTALAQSCHCREQVRHIWNRTSKLPCLYLIAHMDTVAAPGELVAQRRVSLRRPMTTQPCSRMR